MSKIKSEAVIKSVAVNIAVAIATMVALTVVITLLLSSGRIKTDYLKIYISISVLCSCMISAAVTKRRVREEAVIINLVSAAILILIIILTSLCLKPNTVNIVSVLVTISMVAAGYLIPIVIFNGGTNKKHTKKRKNKRTA